MGKARRQSFAATALGSRRQSFTAEALLARSAAKRPGPVASEATLKKMRTAPVSLEPAPPLQGWEAVAAVLDEAEHLPERVRIMLQAMTPLGLGETAEEGRHEYQEGLIEMLAEVLSEIESGMERQIMEGQSKTVDVEAEKALVDAAEVEATRRLASLQEETAEKKAFLEEAAEKLKAAKKASQKAKEAQEEGDADLADAAKKKEALETVRREQFEPFKGRKADKAEGKQALKKLEKMGTEFNFDKSLLLALPLPLVKEPAERTRFDGIILEKFESKLEAVTGELTTFLREGEEGKVERAALAQGAKATQDVAQEAVDARKKAFAEAKALEMFGREAKTVAGRAVGDFMPNMKKAMDALDATRAKLAAFREGPLSAFEELKEKKPRPDSPETEVLARSEES